MLRQDVRIGMRVYFGRDNGEKTLGEVVKLNPTKAKVKTLEERGHGRGGKLGSVWGVPYSMMEPAKNGETAVVTPKQVVRAVFGMKSEDRAILLAIAACYDELSPETLTCDGEASKAHVITRRGELNRKLKALFLAYGSEVTEDEVVDLVGHSNRRN